MTITTDIVCSNSHFFFVFLSVLRNVVWIERGDAQTGTSKYKHNVLLIKVKYLVITILFFSWTQSPKCLKQKYLPPLLFMMFLIKATSVKNELIGKFWNVATSQFLQFTCCVHKRSNHGYIGRKSTSVIYFEKVTCVIGNLGFNIIIWILNTIEKNIIPLWGNSIDTWETFENKHCFGPVTKRFVGFSVLWCSGI